MMKSLKSMFATSLVILAIGTFSACTQAGQEIGEEPGIDVTERETAGPAQTREAGVREGAGLNELEAGRDYGYYANEFDRLGYEVRDVDYHTDRAIYDLFRDNRMYRVELNRPANTDAVSRINVREMQYTTGDAAQQDQEYQRVVQQVRQLQPGKKPIEYVSQLSQMGTLTEYEAEANEASATIEVNGNEYEINMNVDPNTRNVTRMQVEEEFWSI